MLAHYADSTYRGMLAAVIVEQGTRNPAPGLLQAIPPATLLIMISYCCGDELLEAPEAAAAEVAVALEEPPATTDEDTTI
jgi:hypothetical protein